MSPLFSQLMTVGADAKAGNRDRQEREMATVRSTKSWNPVLRSPFGWLVSLLLVLAVGASACSSSTTGEGSASSPPASPSAPPASGQASSSVLCADLAALQQTGDTIRNLPKNTQSLPALKTAATTTKQQLDKLVSDARGQYQAQTDAVSAATSALQGSVDAATKNPNTGTLSAVRASAAGLATALQNLKKAIPVNC